LKAGNNGKKNLKIMLGLTFELSFAEKVWRIQSSKRKQQQETHSTITYRLYRRSKHGI